MHGPTTKGFSKHMDSVSHLQGFAWLYIYVFVCSRLPAFPLLPPSVLCARKNKQRNHARKKRYNKAWFINKCFPGANEQANNYGDRVQNIISVGSKLDMNIMRLIRSKVNLVSNLEFELEFNLSQLFRFST